MDLNPLEFQQQMQEILQLPLSLPQEDMGLHGVDSLPLMPMGMSVGHADMSMGAMGLADMHTHTHMQAPMQLQVPMQMPMHLSHTHAHSQVHAHTHAHTLNGMSHPSLSHAHMSSLPMTHMHMLPPTHPHAHTHAHSHTHAYSSSQPAVVVDKHRKVLTVAKKRKAITPYIRFCSEQRPYLKDKYPDATFIELGKMFGRMWNQLTDEQKAKYNTPTAHELAEQEQDLEDAADHASKHNSNSNKNNKNKRKTVTPYIRFCSEQRPFLKQKYPDATFIELGKMFGRIWNQLTDVQKAKYAVAQPGEHGYVEENDEEEGADGAEKPKRQKTITPYIRFCSEQRPFLKAKYPDMAFTDMGKMFGRMWNQLTDEQKAKYAAPREEY